MDIDTLLQCTASDLVKILRESHSLRELEQLTGINRGTLSHILGGRETTEGKWRKLAELVIAKKLS